MSLNGLTVNIEAEKSQKSFRFVVSLLNEQQKPIDLVQSRLSLNSHPLIHNLKEVAKKEPGATQFIPLSGRVALSLLKEAAALGVLRLNHKPLVANFFLKGRLGISLDEHSIPTLTVSIQDKEIPAEDCSFFVKADMWYTAKDQVIYPIDIDISKPFLEKILLKTPLLEEEVVALEEIARDEPYGLTLKKVQGSIKTQETPKPILEISDSKALFANLIFAYGDEEIAFHSPTSSLRLKEDESFWLEELKRAGYQEKRCGNTTFFCPTHLIKKTLTTLLEEGWTLRLPSKKQIELAKSFNIEIQLDERVGTIHGDVNSDHNQVDLQKALRAYKAQETLIETDHGVILLPEKMLRDALPLIDFLVITQKETLGPREAFIGYTAPQGVKMTDNIDSFPQANKIQSFTATLRPYQEIGVRFLETLSQRKLGALLADEMGLGKTVQTLALLAKTPGPHLIVAPTTLLYNWQQEAQRFIPDAKVILFHGKARDVNTLQTAEIVLTSYGMVRQETALSNIHWSTLVLDEAQTIKNAQTATHIALTQFKARFRLSLTGTPIENRASELIAQMQFLLPNLNPVLKEHQSTTAISPSLKQLLSPFILRRTKQEVLPELPPRIDQTILVEMGENQERVYNQLLTHYQSGLIKKVRSNGLQECRMEVLEAILRLRQVACHPQLFDPRDEGVKESGKLQLLLNDIQELPGKACIFSQFTSMLGLIAEALTEQSIPFAYLDGSTKNREEVIARFQNDPNCPLFLMSLKAGGVGLNLQQASTIFLFEPWWNRAAEEQAIARAHRMGQKETLVTKRYISAGTIEEKITILQQSKQQLNDQLFDTEGSFFPEHLTDLEALLS